MPIRVLDEPSRRDLIAYSRQAGTAAAGGGSGS